MKTSVMSITLIFTITIVAALWINLHPETSSVTNLEEVVSVETCKDCGGGGWQVMEEKCAKPVLDKTRVRDCMTVYTWSNMNRQTNLDRIEVRFIEVGGYELLEKPGKDDIKVFAYQNHAVDEDGNIYLLSQLG